MRSESCKTLSNTKTVCHHTGDYHDSPTTIAPQPIRAQAAPEGWEVKSSVPAWTIMLFPTTSMKDCLFLSMTNAVVSWGRHLVFRAHSVSPA